MTLLIHWKVGVNKMDVNTKKSFWRIGKEHYRAFCELKLKRSTNFKSIFFGLLLTAVLVVPLAVFVFQFIEVYWYNNPQTMFIFLSIAFALFMACNGLSNYITVKAVKLVETDMENLQELDEWAIFFYQFLNPWFALQYHQG